MISRLLLLVPLVLVLACAGAGPDPLPAAAPEASVASAAPPAVTAAGAIAEAGAIVQTHQAEDLGICDYEGGWGYRALRALDAPDDPSIAVAADEDPSLAPLRETDLYKRWHQARTVALASDVEIVQFMRANPDWHDLSGVPKRLTFAADGAWSIQRIGSDGPPDAQGRWSVQGGRVRLDADGQSISAGIRSGSWSLVLEAAELGTFLPDPIVEAC